MWASARFPGLREACRVIMQHWRRSGTSVEASGDAIAGLAYSVMRRSSDRYHRGLDCGLFQKPEKLKSRFVSIQLCDVDTDLSDDLSTDQARPAAARGRDCIARCRNTGPRTSPVLPDDYTSLTEAGGRWGHPQWPISDLDFFVTQLVQLL